MADQQSDSSLHSALTTEVELKNLNEEEEEMADGGDNPERLTTVTPFRLQHNASEVDDMIDDMCAQIKQDPSDRIAEVRHAIEQRHRVRLQDGLIEVATKAEDIHAVAQPVILGASRNE